MSTSLALDLDGATALAASAAQASGVLGKALDQAHADAGPLVVGAVKVPIRTGRLASTVHAETTPDGFAVFAGGPAAPYALYVGALDDLRTALYARRDAVVATIHDALQAAVAHLKGA